MYIGTISSRRFSTTELISSIRGQEPGVFDRGLIGQRFESYYADRDLPVASVIIPQIFPRKLVSCRNLLPFDTRRPNEDICRRYRVCREFPEAEGARVPCLLYSPYVRLRISLDNLLSGDYVDPSSKIRIDVLC